MIPSIFQLYISESTHSKQEADKKVIDSWYAESDDEIGETTNNSNNNKPLNKNNSHERLGLLGIDAKRIYSK